MNMNFWTCYVYDMNAAFHWYREEKNMRLGKFSGRVYTEDEAKNMKECGVCISDENAADEKWCQKHHLEDLMDCLKCFGCPMAQKSM